MTPRLKINEIHENLWSLDEVGRTVMWVINGRDRALLIDTGFGMTDLKKVVRQLCGDKEIVVVNSHGHIDHNSGNNQFDTVHVGRYDEYLSHDEVDQAEQERVISNFYGPYLESGGEIGEWNPGPAGHIVTVKEDDVFELGGYTLRVIEVPSHSFGSIALHEEEQGWLFTGDTMLTWEVWGQLRESTALLQYRDSMKKLQGLRVADVFPAHWQEDRNPRHLTAYRLPPEVIDIYVNGIEDILTGKAEIVDYDFDFVRLNRKVMCSFFEIGGIAFDPGRLGI